MVKPPKSLCIIIYPPPLNKLEIDKNIYHHIAVQEKNVPEILIIINGKLNI